MSEKIPDILNTKNPDSNPCGCLGKIYQKGKYIVHPVTLNLVTDVSNDFCTHDIINFDNKSFFGVPCNKSKYTDKQLDYSVPEIGFNCGSFLYDIYGIKNMDEGFNYLTKSNLSIYSKMRIVSCLINLYAISMEIIDIRLIECLLEIFSTIWINDMYKQLRKYIVVQSSSKGEEIYLGKVKDDSNNKNKKLNFFKEKILSTDIISRYINNYINKNADKWFNINDHIEKIKKGFINYIEKKIK